jgi:branched-chain amino acid transport system substrate-binding protein
LLCALLLTAGCGSAHSSGELKAAEGTQALPAEAAATAAPVQPAAEGTGAAPAETVGSAPADAATGAVHSPGSAQPATPTVASPGAKPQAKTAAGAATPSSGASNAGQKPTGGGSGTAGAAQGGAAPGGQPGIPVPGSPSGSSSGPKAEIVLGSFGVESGPIGQILLGAYQTARVWVQDINARGGLNGHPVRLVTGDDGGDPGKTQALVRRMIDQDKVVAFFVQHACTTWDAAAPILEQAKIPVIGSAGCNATSSQSSIQFAPGQGEDYGIAWGHLLPLLQGSDKRKISVLYCREAISCKKVRDHNFENAGKAGIQIVHEAAVTLTQPDYTAEILAARNAGAEAFLLAIDNFSVQRFVRGAKRQNWNPPLGVQYSGHDERFLQGGKDIEGNVFIGGAAIDWNSPKMADYRTAMARFGASTPKGSPSERAWMAGKLLEVIAKNFPAVPSKDDFFKGVYALRGETLGGLVPPMTFKEGRGSDETNLCSIIFKVESGRFVPLNGDNWTCPPGWQPPTK